MDTHLPDYLRSKSHLDVIPFDGENENVYDPIWGSWLIEMALFFDWPGMAFFHDIQEFLESEDFMKLTGPRIINGGPVYKQCMKTDTPSQKHTRLIRGKLIERRDELRQTAFPEYLPLFVNIDRLARTLSLNNAEKALLTFATAVQCSESFCDFLSSRSERLSLTSYSRLIARLTGQSIFEIQSALERDRTLIMTGLLLVTKRYGTSSINEVVELMPGMGSILMSTQKDEASLMGMFLKKLPPPELELSAFQHLERDGEVLVSYLRSALKQSEPGANILLYGPPGTGKTEFAKAICTAAGVELFEVNYANKTGEPIRGASRLRSFTFSQSVLKTNHRAVLLFDEIEDIFRPSGRFVSLFEDDNKEPENTEGKAWINRMLENNPVPAIWITNYPYIDPAYLRRFTYSVRLPVPPHSVRVSIARHHLNSFTEDEAWLRKIAVSSQQTPGQIERAARFASLASEGDNSKTRSLVELALDRSAQLLRQKHPPFGHNRRLRFDLRYINADQEFTSLIECLRRTPQGTFCFHGPAGTGKSELAREIALAINKDFLIKRASDLLSPWLGETEQNIASMFNEATTSDSVLILDEADSFLADRRDATRSWEVTQVNEFLTQMEAFEGILICTTNLMSRLDQASLRRFDYKVRFNYLNPDQRWTLFEDVLQQFGGEPPEKGTWTRRLAPMNQLTPGDFAVAYRQFYLKTVPSSAEALCQILEKECRLKEGAHRGIGFTASGGTLQ